MTAPRKNPAAVALGRLGGNANTEAQRRARSANGKNGGRKTVYRLVRGKVERLEAGAWARVEPLDAAAKAWIRRTRAA